MFRSKFFSYFAIISLLVLLPQPAQAQEVITAFEVELEVQPDSSLFVTENISVVAQGHKIKRGIYRDFPTQHRFPDGTLKSTTFQVQKILRDGQPDGFHFKDISAGKRVYIGRKNFKLKPGEYTYTLNYRTERQLRYFDEFDELYWNVTGNHWAFPIDYASVKIQLPQGADILGQHGYTGPEGSKGQQYRVQRISGNEIFFETTRPLRKKEGFTVALSFPKGFVYEPSPEEKRAQFWKDNKLFFGGLAMLVLILIYYFYVWHHFGRDPKKGTVIPLFEPPEGLSPALCRYILQMGEMTWRTAFTASIVNLAVKGFVKIEKVSESSFFTKPTYRIRQIQTPDAKILPAEEYLLAKTLLEDGEILMKQSNSEQILRAFKMLKKRTKLQAGKTYFFKNQSFLIIGVLLNILFGLMITAEAQSAELFELMIPFSMLVMMFSHFTFKLFLSTKHFMLKALGLTGLVAVLLFLPAIFASVSIDAALDWRVALIFSAMVGVNTLFAELLMAPTQMGRKIMDDIEGFKLFLGVAEKERFEFLHPPEITPEVFEKYLPYAIVLDVENEWAKKFETSMAAAAAAGQDYRYRRPRWYEGSDFSARDISGFTSSFSSALSTSAGSASGGGGSSGGGGGGGGGGGW